jgi:hypothetical protein
MSAEYEIVLDISFLVDKIGAADVSPFDPTTASLRSSSAHSPGACSRCHPDSSGSGRAP